MPTVRLIKYLTPREPSKLVNNADSEVSVTSRSTISIEGERLSLPRENSSVPAARAEEAESTRGTALVVNFIVWRKASDDEVQVMATSQEGRMRMRSSVDVRADMLFMSRQCSSPSGVGWSKGLLSHVGRMGICY